MECLLCVCLFLRVVFCFGLCFCFLLRFPACRASFLISDFWDYDLPLLSQYAQHRRKKKGCRQTMDLSFCGCTYLVLQRRAKGCLISLRQKRLASLVCCRPPGVCLWSPHQISRHFLKASNGGRLVPLGSYSMSAPWAELFPPQRTQKLMSNVACEGSHIRILVVLDWLTETTLYLPSFKGVVPSQHSSILGVEPYCGLTVH